MVSHGTVFAMLTLRLIRPSLRLSPGNLLFGQVAFSVYRCLTRSTFPFSLGTYLSAHLH
jgi:hypothetical protein